MANPAASRRTFPFIDAMRGAAAMVILTHHLITYVPRADEFLAVVPWVRDALWWHGGLATQVFLVISGFVNGVSLVGLVPKASTLGRLLVVRYLRLAVPAAVTLLVAIGLHGIMPRSYETFPLFDELSAQAVVAHTVLVQDMLGYPSLLAGFWYLSIDLQCYAVMCLLILVQHGIRQRLPGPSSGLREAVIVGIPLAVAVVSLFCWNGVAAHEAYATYFFGIMFLGTLAGLAVAGRLPAAIFWAYAAACGVAIVVQGRPQPAAALATGVAMYLLACRQPSPAARSDSRIGLVADYLLFQPLFFLGRISYALFLVHYPVIWLVTSLARGALGEAASRSVPCLAVAVAASIAAAVLLHRLVEIPMLTFVARIKPTASPAPQPAA